MPILANSSGAYNYLSGGMPYFDTGVSGYAKCVVCATQFSGDKLYCSVECRMQAQSYTYMDLTLRPRRTSPTATPYNHDPIVSKCNAQLLWGELAWVLCDMTAYDDKFLTIADKVLEDEHDRSAIISLLQEIESDGYEVNWEACVEVPVEKYSVWIRVKFKILKWIEHLLGDSNDKNAL